MVRLRNKAIIEMNEKDLYDRLKQIRAELFKLNVESKKIIKKHHVIIILDYIF